MAVPGNIIGEFSFESDEEPGTCRDLLFRSKGQGSEEKQNCYGNSSHRKFSGRSGGGFGGQVLGLRS